MSHDFTPGTEVISTFRRAIPAHHFNEALEHISPESKVSDDDDDEIDLYNQRGVIIENPHEYADEVATVAFRCGSIKRFSTCYLNIVSPLQQLAEALDQTEGN